MKKISLFCIIFIFLLTIIFLISVKFISEKQKNLLENVFIENYTFNKLENNLNAVIALVVVNLNNKPLHNLPIKIDYYSKDGSYLSSDICDILEFTNTSIKPATKKQFQIEVTFPRDTEVIEVKVKK